MKSGERAGLVGFLGGVGFLGKLLHLPARLRGSPWKRLRLCNLVQSELLLALLEIDTRDQQMGLCLGVVILLVLIE